MKSDRARIDEVAPDVFPINIVRPGSPITYSCFLVVDAALDKIEALSPATLACHHGAVKAHAIASYLSALRQADVIGVTA